MKTYEYDRPIPREQPNPAPSLLDAAKELADLMDDVRSGDYKPDSFTCQHIRAAIAAEEARGEERRFEIAARQDEIEAWKQVDKAWKRVDTQTKKVLESNESEISRLRAENAELRALMPDALKIIDAHRRITGGEGDTIAMNIRETIKEQGA